MGNPNFWRTGRAVAFYCCAAVAILQAQQFASVASFLGTNGQFPSQIIQGADGNFYGIASGGGANNAGAVFKMTASGTITTLYSFSSPTTIPTLMQAKDGNFYGTTNADGINHLGTIFKLTPSGTFSILYQFTNSDGGNPYAPMIQGTDGNFYGTTSQGGPGVGALLGQGTVFQFTPSGTLTVLYGFSGQDGAFPRGALLQAKDGNFYGVTEFGGSGPCNGFGVTPNGCGTVFKITASGTLTTLHNFTSGGDDGYPISSLIVGADGNFYGFTAGAGSAQNGIAYRITPTGTLATLVTFDINQPLNEGPKAGLILASDGNFYGADLTKIFKFTPAGTLTNLYTFCEQSPCTDGAGPNSMVLGTDGNLYGTTNFGGSGSCMFSAFLPGGCGTVFKWTVSSVTPPPPTGPAITLVANAEGGESPTIAGNTWVEIKGSLLSKTQRTWQGSDFVNNQLPISLDGVSVSMNGTAAYVYFISQGQINVLTPTNLGTGPVQVVVTSNSVPSNAFQVQSAGISPAFFVFDGTHIIAEHLSGAGGCATGVVVCLVGPSTLIAGQTTPASSGETIILFMNGFGAVNQTLIPGSLAQGGSLATLPTMTVSGLAANVTFAGLISPGLFQFNVTLPQNLPNGDNPVKVQYQNQATPVGAVLAIQN